MTDDAEVTSSGDLTHDERVRINALGNATTFVYGYNLAKDKDKPLLRASDVLNVSELFRVYIETGENTEATGK